MAKPIIRDAATQLPAELSVGQLDLPSDPTTALGAATKQYVDVKADKSITLTAGTGLSGGGDLSANRSFALATVADAGGGTLLRLIRDAWGRITGTSTPTTTDLAEGTNLYYTDVRADARITAQKGVASGLAPLGSDAKINVTYLPAAVLGQVSYQGTWNASLGTPPTTTPSKGWYYIVTVAGSTSLGGITSWNVGDWAIYDTAWDKVDNTDAISSWNGRTGVVVPATGDYTFAQIGSTPTTLAGYGITNAALDTSVVHLAGAETITGAKTFNANVALGAGASINMPNGGTLASWVAGAYIKSGTGGGTVVIGSSGAGANALSIVDSTGTAQCVWDSGGAMMQSQLATFTGGITAAGATLSSTLTVNAVTNLNSTVNVAGILNTAQNTNTAAIASTATAANALQIRSNSTSPAYFTFIRNGAYAFQFGMDTDNFLKVGGWSMGAVSYRIVHEGLTAVTLAGTIAASNLSGTNTGDQNLAPYAPLSGAAFTGPVTGTSLALSSTLSVASNQGITLGSSVGGSITDLAKGIALFGGTGSVAYGFVVTSNTLNVNSGSTAIKFNIGGTTYGTLTNTTGLSITGAGSFAGNVAVSGNVTSTGGSGGFFPNDRSTGLQWGFYATGGVCYIFNVTNGNIASFNVAGDFGMNIAGRDFLRANANSTTQTRQPRTFVQSGDPGAAAADGDLWIW